ncbi:hypothetical protein CBL_07249 [Carabus blaptoides fortunei]
MSASQTTEHTASSILSRPFVLRFIFTPCGTTLHIPASAYSTIRPTNPPFLDLSLPHTTPRRPSSDKCSVSSCKREPPDNRVAGGVNDTLSKLSVNHTRGFCFPDAMYPQSFTETIVFRET